MTATSAAPGGPVGQSADPDFAEGRCPSGSQDPAIVRLAAISNPPGSATAPATAPAFPSALPSSVPLPAGFTATAVVRCRVEEQDVVGDGDWEVAVGQRATSGINTLMTALRLPSASAPPGSNIACAAVGILLPNFALVDAQGRILRPILPHDVCDQPLNQALDALNALPWKTETEQKLDQVASAAAVATGCPPAYKDVFEMPAVPEQEPWVPFASASASASASDNGAGLNASAACEYKVSSATDGSIGLGAFASGVTLDAARTHTIAAALAASGSVPAKACSAKPAARFALLVVGTQDIAVELGGCHRMIYPNLFVAPAPDAILNVLSAAGID